MHFVISGTWGPTDPTRAMLPFIFAASAIQDNDTVTLMLFHDAVLMAVAGAAAKLVPVGPPNRYEEVVSHPNVTLWACRPCLDARAIVSSSLDQRVKLGGKNAAILNGSGWVEKIGFPGLGFLIQGRDADSRPPPDRAA